MSSGQIQSKKNAAESGALKPRARKPAARAVAPVAGMVLRTIYARDIAGIMYYVDNDGNVYKHEDVLANKPNPRIIGTATSSGMDSKFQIILKVNENLGGV